MMMFYSSRRNQNDASSNVEADTSFSNLKAPLLLHIYNAIIEVSV